MIARIITSLILAAVLICCAIITVLLVIDPSPKVIACVFITYCNGVTSYICWRMVNESDNTIRILESLKR